MASTKYKTFKLLEILYNNTDFTHRLKTNELISLLADEGIKCDRRSIYDDIKLFNSLGIDVKKDVGYYIDNRKFTLEEIKLLTDIIISSDFLTSKQIESLSRKLIGELPKSEEEIVKQQMFINYNNDKLIDIGKPYKNDVMKNIRYLTLAINSKSAISIKSTNNNRAQIISPYSLVFYNREYYLIGYNRYAKKMYHFRVDKIRSVTASNYPYIEPKEVSDYQDAVDTADYITKTYKMYSSSEECTVTLRFKPSLLEYLLRYFPDLQIKTKAGKNNVLEAQTKVNLSDGFYNYILGYGGQVEILEPENIAHELKNRAQKIADMYK